MKKILVVQETILHYRIPIFNKLATHYDLTVTAEKFEDKEKYNFNTIPIETRSKGPFSKIKKFRDLSFEDYDIVIFLFNIRFIDLLLLLWKGKRNYKLILWGIGVSSENGYDNNPRYDQIRYWAAKKTDAVVFYSNDPIKKYSTNGVDINKLFVANNTLDLTPQYFEDDKEYFLFVGTLKKYKRIDLLISLFAKVIKKNPDIPPLHIIGDGEYMKDLVNQIDMLNLKGKVKLFGAITDTDILKKHYSKAIASLSPHQAGLGVLQALSMGVPFITNKDSVTGGERFNIIDGHNGFLIDSEEHFINTLINLHNKPELVKELSTNAFKYFKEQCSVDNMINGFVNAINYSLLQKRE